MKHFRFFFLFVLVAALPNKYLDAQVTVLGATCVTYGVIYQYNVSASWDSTSKLQLCITGGILIDGAKSCVEGRPASIYKIRWNENSRSGKIEIRSSRGNTTLTVGIVALLKPGVLDTTGTRQLINFDSKPVSLICSEATGGNCNPVYKYQWQYSDNGDIWIDIPNAISKNLTFDSSLKMSRYFRRKVMETGSGSIAFTAIAAIGVKRSERKQD